MSNTLAFKCYLSTNGSQDNEIRRFTLESDVVGNFTYLKEKVRSIYPQLLRDNFSLMYIGKCTYKSPMLWLHNILYFKNIHRWGGWQDHYFKWWWAGFCPDVCQAQGEWAIPPHHSGIIQVCSLCCCCSLFWRKLWGRDSLWSDLWWMSRRSSRFPLQMYAVPWFWPVRQVRICWSTPRPHFYSRQRANGNLNSS